MSTKLTLNVDKEVIEKAKIYAKEQNTSLSKLVESMLSRLISKAEPEELSPLVKSLHGVMKLPENYNPKKEYRKYLEKKYQ